MAIPDYIDFQGTIVLRRGTKLQWETKNPILREGEMGLELPNHVFKMGDGTTRWKDLPYVGIKGDQGVQGPKGDTGPTGDVTPAATAAANAAAASATAANTARNGAEDARDTALVYKSAAEAAAANASSSANTASTFAQQTSQDAQKSETQAGNAQASATAASASKDVVIAALNQIQDGKRDVWNAGLDYVAGYTAELNLSQVPLRPSTVQLFFNGLFQFTDGYTINGKKITFTSPIPTEVTRIEAVYSLPGTAYSQEVIDAGTNAVSSANAAAASASAAATSAAAAAVAASGTRQVFNGVTISNSQIDFDLTNASPVFAKQTILVNLVRGEMALSDSCVIEILETDGTNTTSLYLTTTVNGLYKDIVPFTIDKQATSNHIILRIHGTANNATFTVNAF
ncbi:hypothetical protein [Ralstonia phage RSP15]|uniref:virion structural protein n=1 Tax=Ralstonia phage RSP15 TaxID=1785960 RepID=UPI00074D295F|nr:virion structural protein [Ralstonia phage RSP15]BAU39961.1 hypothetical protein [Ralstonia phage RSP15]